MHEMIQEELQAVRTMQTSLLVNIQKSFAEKRNIRTMTRFFNAYYELYSQRVEVRKQKTQACIQLERVFRRQIRKRQRNCWKAMSQQPFVSDLADEEVFSLNSGSVRNVHSRMRHSVRSPSFHDSGSRSMSARHVGSPHDPMKSPIYSRTTTQSSQYNDNKIKGGIKLVEVQVRRKLQMIQPPTVEQLFHCWKLKVNLMKKQGRLVIRTQASQNYLSTKLNENKSTHSHSQKYIKNFDQRSATNPDLITF